MLKYTDVVTKDICQVFAIFLTSFFSFFVICEAVPTWSYSVALVAVVLSSGFLGGYLHYEQWLGEGGSASDESASPSDEVRDSSKRVKMLCFVVGFMVAVRHFANATLVLDHAYAFSGGRLSEFGYGVSGG